MLFIPIITHDSSIGRFDPDLLDTQTRMELFIAELPPGFQDKYRDSSGDYIDYYRWDMVSTDETGNVTRVLLYSMLGGTVALQYLPETVVIVKVHGWKRAPLHGTVEFSELPRGLTTIDVAKNALTGSADLRSLPPTLSSLRAQRNKFSGSLSLEMLPGTLEVLELDHNCFSGDLCLSKLPPKLRIFELSGNALTGDIVLENVPETLIFANFRKNKFDGALCVLEEKHNAAYDFSLNQLTGTAYIHSSCGITAVIDKNQIEAVLDENGVEYNSRRDKSGFISRIW